MEALKLLRAGHTTPMTPACAFINDTRVRETRLTPFAVALPEPKCRRVQVLGRQTV